MKIKSKVIIAIVLALALCLSISMPVLAAVPTVVTYNAIVDGTNVTANGNITATGVVGNDDIRGFVWDTVSRAAPGNVAPVASGYADNWTEVGSFNVGVFDYEITGLTALVTYYYRACAHSADGWAYGDEISFFPLVVGKVYFELRPDLAETKIRGQGGIPSDATVGEFNGYSLPIYADDFEQLNYVVCVPDRWDGESDILIHIDCALAGANESGNSYEWEMLWEHFTPNEDIVPATSNEVNYVRDIWSNDQYQSYQDWMVIDYDIDAGDLIVADDLIAITVRRETVVPLQKTDSGEIIVFAIDILFARGDLLGDPDGWIDDLIDDGILIGGVDLIYLFLSLIALGLTIAMFATRNLMLGFPCVIFWAVLGGYAYTESTIAWGDWQYYLFFASFGMVIFSALAMYGLREKRDTIADEEMEKGDGGYIDEGNPTESDNLEESEVSERTRKLRERAKNRRSGKSRRTRL